MQAEIWNMQMLLLLHVTNLYLMTSASRTCTVLNAVLEQVAVAAGLQSRCDVGGDPEPMHAFVGACPRPAVGQSLAAGPNKH